METNRFTLKDSYIDILDSAFVGPDAEITRPGDFSFFFMNIIGINNKFEELLSLLKSFAKLPNCIVLVETWLSPEIAAYFAINGYTAHHLFRAGKRGGGISVFVSNETSQIRFTSADTINNNLELIKIELRIDSAPYNLFAIYRPPNGDIGHFLSKLEDSISISPNTSTLLAGDFNIDLLDGNNFGPAFRLKTLLVSFGFTLDINKVTRLNPSTNTKGTLIDHIWTNFDMVSPLSRVISYQLSDHFPLSLSFFPNNKPRNSTKTVIQFRQMNTKNVEKFVDKLNNLSLDHQLLSGDICDKWNRFYTVLTESFHACCPLKTKIADKRDKAPWFNRDIKSLIKQKHAMYKLLMSGVVSKNVYKQFCNKVTYCIRKRKNEYYAKLYRNQYSSKNKWSILKQHIGQFKSTKNILEIKSSDGDLVTDPVCVASTFNSYFTSVGDQLASTIPSTNTSFTEFLTSPNPNSFYFHPTYATEIENIISSLRNTAPQQHDKIPVRILKIIKKLISPHLSTLINESIQSGTVPRNLKVAKVIPLHKSGDQLMLSNYRPISLLPAMSKIFEKVIHSRISSFLEKYNRLHPSQFGFRSSRNTSSAIQVILHNIYHSMEKRLIAANVYLDFAKAFDTVPHDIILAKLRYHGIRGQTLNWFESYLSDRTQFVSLGEAQSSPDPVTRGVPQGSILGPLLFIIMINDLFGSHNLNMVSYADDTTLITDASSTDELHSKIVTALQNVCRWTNANMLKLNISKTKYTIFTNKKNINGLGPISVDNQLVTPCQEYKILGLTLDASLSFKTHVGKVCRRLAFCTHILRKLGNGINRKVKRTIYCPYADPHIRYCLEYYGNTFKKYTKHVLKHQKTLFKMIAGGRSLASDGNSSFPEPYLLNYDSLLKYQISCLMFKLVKNQFELPLADTFTRVPDSPYQLRNSCTLALPQIRLEKSKQSLHWTGTKVWNSIPAQIKDMPFSSFKKNLKSYLLQTK